MYAEHLNDITSHIDCLHSNITKIEDDSLHGYYEGLFKSLVFSFFYKFRQLNPFFSFAMFN